MSTGVDEAAVSSSRNVGTSSTSAGDQTTGSMQFRNGVTSPGSPGSEADSTINSTAFAPSILASRLGRGIYSSTGAASSSLSLSASGFNSPALALTGFNAVSTVLNNPSKRQHPIDPKSSRFPPVTPNHVPADIPKVKKAELDSYLSSVRPEWDRFMRNQSMGRQGKATIEQQQQQQRQQRRSSARDSSYDSESLDQHTSRHRSTNSVASLSSDLQAVPPPQARKRLPNLSAVPQVFFSEVFDLGNPYTFDQVTERYKVAATSPSDQNGGAAPDYDVALNQMLQEKLSYYSDVIEQHLIIEIGQQSSSFFAALENLNDLNAEAESCLRKIGHLKSELEHIDENQAKRGLKVIQQQQHRRQLERQQAIVQDVRQLVERRDLVRLLLQQGETEEALDLLNKLRSALRQPDGHHGPVKTDTNGATSTDTGTALSDLQCLASIPSQLDEMEQTLSGMLEQELVAILRQDIDARLESFAQNRVASTSSADRSSYFATDSIQSGSLTLHSSITASEPPLAPAKTATSPFAHSARTLSSHDSDLATRIAPLVGGLAKTGGIEKAVALYREATIQAVREIWSATLSQSGEEMAETVKWLLAEDLSKYDDHDSLPAPAARIRDLEHSSFLTVGRNLFETLVECLKTVDAQCALMLRILNGLASGSSSNDAETPVEGDDKANSLPSGIAPSTKLPSPPTVPRGVPTTLPAKLSDVVVASAEQAHSLCARLLSLRATTHAALELPPFLVVFQLCWSFVLSSEQLCRKMIVGLRGTVLGQAKGFLANFHRRRIERAAKAVEEETWAQADVGAHIQSQIRQIVSSAVRDPSDFVVTAGDSHSDATVEVTEDADVDQAATSTKTLDIEDRQYFVVDASLDVLALLVDYLKVVINLPLLTTEAMARVVEFLKQFNSRTCQVVLGAGAMRSAGLKNITAKHLALASQSLSIMISLIPYIRETVRRHLSPKQAVMLTEFDKLRRDFQQHQYEIHAKLVAIMSDRLTVHCRTLSALDWNADTGAAQDKPQGDESKDAEPNKYAVDLVKETATLHKVLSKYLQPVVVEHVIGQVLRAIDARVAQEFEKIPVKNQQAIDRMQTDVRYLGTKLSVLKHVEWKDEALQQVLAAKHVPHAAPAVNVPASTGSSTPNSETIPGSPALDKPAASPFGPVTYKPRIPNIFARRQQQQLSQSGSPRASTDVPPSSAPGETQQSADSTPRTSLQIQPQQPANATQGSQQPASPALESSKGLSTSIARSVEEEASDLPPTPPSKSQEIRSTPSVIVRTEETDAGEEEDLVAPVVPAPEAVARVLAEGGESSSDLADASVARGADVAVESVKKATPNEAADVDDAPHDEQGQARVDTAARVASQDGAQEQATQEASTTDSKPDEATGSKIKTFEVSASAASEESETQRPSTPKKDSVSVAAVAAEASPARSGASTPAGTPVKPGRMSLKERLAEAARKRAQQSSSAARPSSQPEPPATATATTQPSETAPENSAAAVADTSGTADKPRGRIVEASTKTEEAPEPSVAEDTDQLNASEPSAESQHLDQNSLGTVSDALHVKESEEPKETSDCLTKTAIGETSASSAADEPEGAIVDASKNLEAAELVPTNDSAVALPTDEQAAKVDGEGSQSSSLANATNPSEQASSHAATPAEAHGDREGDDDGDGDGDDAEAEADGDVNETTNDSAVGGGSSSSSKKNKKKKKKGRKK